jgi:hypothetical protein
LEQAVLLLSSSLASHSFTSCNSIELVLKPSEEENFVEVMQTYVKNGAAKNLLRTCGKLSEKKMFLISATFLI